MKIKKWLCEWCGIVFLELGLLISCVFMLLSLYQLLFVERLFSGRTP